MLHFVIAVAICLLAGSAGAQDSSATEPEFREELELLKQQNAAMQLQLDRTLKQLDELSSQVSGAEGTAGSGSALDRALGSTPSTAQQASQRGSPRAVRPRLADLSLVTNFAAGGSSVRDDDLQRLQAGEHDPRKRGFTLQQAELTLMGAVDPYFSGEMHLIYFLDPDGESQFEVEEVFLTTQALPHGLQLKAGTYFTEFGRLNARHPHFWKWQDQPVILSRLMGPDGLRGPGSRISWLSDLPWYSELFLNVQNANGETAVSFLSSDEFTNAVGAPIVIGGRPFVEREVRSGGDMLWSARWLNAFDLGDTVSAALGVSGAFGPNSSGPDGDTTLLGGDAVIKWHPEDQRGGWPFFTLETEYMFREYQADANPAAGLASDDLEDWGGYVQGLWGFRPRWAAGLRLEYAGGSGESVGGRSDDPFRDSRFRASPLLAFYPSEYSRLRLQYNYDRATHLDDDAAHTIWLGFEFTLGAHPAHQF